VGFENQDRRRKEDVDVIESREPEPVEVFICLKSPRART
jgi:hypothetical protein